MFFLFSYIFLDVNNDLIVDGENSSGNYLMVVYFDVFFFGVLFFLLFLIVVDIYKYVGDVVCCFEFWEIICFWFFFVYIYY